MKDSIFGYTWEEIQSIQQKQYFRKNVSGHCYQAGASQADIEMLRDKGINYIKGNLLYGVIDRLQTSGIIPKD